MEKDPGCFWKEEWKKVKDNWGKLLRRDQLALFSFRSRVEKELAQNNFSSVERFLIAFEKAMARSLVPSVEKLEIHFPESLPVTNHVEEIRKAFREHKVVIVCGSTGSGKTTQLPKVALLEGMGRTGMIGCTQPRRIAASSLGTRFAEETKATYGKEVGCKIRFEDRTSPETAVKFMTDGILLAETRSDPLLTAYDCIILDEVHERSLNIDFLLGYMQLLLKKRSDLHVIISSATLESGRIAEFFGDAAIVEVEGGLFPVEDCAMPPEEDEDLGENVARAAEFLLELDDSGDILVFLPGEREIRETLELLEGRFPRGVELLPLFGRLSAGEQNRIFQHAKARRRIILATNVAETSLTIPGIRFVIDSGLVRLSRYNPRSRIQELQVEQVSQASARQRRGRCGRLRDGVCVRLYSDEVLAASDPYTSPEIQRSSLAGVILQMASLGLPPIEEFPLVDPPSGNLIREGRRTLDDLHAVTKEGHLTPIGRRLAHLPLDPHLGMILLAAEKYKVLPEILVIVSFLSISDPRERPFEKAKEADEAQKIFQSAASDFLGILLLWCAMQEAMGEKGSKTALRKFAAKHFLNFRRLLEWRSLTEELGGMLEKDTYAGTVPRIDFEESEKLYDPIHKAILSGLPRNMALYDTEEKNYMDMGGKKFILFPGSGLAKVKKPSSYLLFFALVETSRIFGRCNAWIRPEFLEEVAPHLCKPSYENVAFDEASGFVYAKEKIHAGAILIHPGRRRHYGKIDPAGARKIFIEEGLALGKASLKGCSWLEKYNKNYQLLASLEEKMRRPDSLLLPDAIFKYFDEKLPPQAVSTESLKHIKGDFAPAIEDMTGGERLPDEEEYPDHLVCGSARFPLTYTFDPESGRDGITVHITEKLLPLFDPHCGEYLVPGYLVWKAEYYLRALPKALRRQLMPMQEAIGEFVLLIRTGELLTERSLEESLEEYLMDHFDLEVPQGCFDTVELPPYLMMKYAVRGENGKVKVYDSFPASRITRKLSTHLSGAKKFSFTNCRTFPGHEPFPKEATASHLSGKKAFPALTDEGETAGAGLFLEEDDARSNHARGLLRLIKLHFPQLEKGLRSGAKVHHDVAMSFFLHDPDWKEDLIDVAILGALDKDPWEIRSEGEFQKACISVSESASEILMDSLSALEDIYEAYRKARKNLSRVREDSLTSEDGEELLAFLFRPGFLKVPEAVANYERYLNSLAIRMERALTSSLKKDEEKGRELAPYIRKFRIAWDSCKKTPPEEQRQLVDFFLLLEEARIAVYTPERPTKRKASPAVLEKAWEALRIR